jgi:hypothetical protein
MHSGFKPEVGIDDQIDVINGKRDLFEIDLNVYAISESH